MINETETVTIYNHNGNRLGNMTIEQARKKYQNKFTDAYIKHDGKFMTLQHARYMRYIA